MGPIHKHFFILALCVCVSVCVNFIVGPLNIVWTFQREKAHRWVGDHCGIQCLYMMRTITGSLVGSVNVSPNKNSSVAFVHVKEH